MYIVRLLILLIMFRYLYLGILFIMLFRSEIVYKEVGKNAMKRINFEG